MLFGVYIFGVAHSCQEKTAILWARAVNFAFRLPSIYSRPAVKMRGIRHATIGRAHLGLTKSVIYAIFLPRFLASARSISDPKK
jgi:hypothetical protein